MFVNEQNIALTRKHLNFQTRKKQKEDVDIVGGSDGEGAIGLSSDPKSRAQMINDRIGYKPQPKPNNRSSQFGTFEFQRWIFLCARALEWSTMMVETQTRFREWSARSQAEYFTSCREILLREIMDA